MFKSEPGGDDGDQLRICCLINPRSGPSETPSPEHIKKLFHSHGVEPYIIELQKGDDISALTKSAIQKKYSIIVAGGGDGTINAIASTLVGVSGVKLGVLPLGTLNHFAKDLKIPTDIAKAVEIIIAGHVQSIDIGEVNGHIFLNNSSVGLYPSIVKLRESLQKTGLSKWPAAARASLRVLMKFHLLRLKLSAAGLDKTDHKTALLFVGNNSYDMSFPTLGTRSTLQSGVMGVMMPRASTRLGLLYNFFSLVFKVQPKSDVLTFETTSLSIKTKRSFVKVALDGEVTMLKSPLNYRIRPKSLRVIVPLADSAKGKIE
jgi:diacylglycerol kinase family enzyme